MKTEWIDLMNNTDYKNEIELKNKQNFIYLHIFFHKIGVFV